MGNLFETASAALARSGEHQYRPRSSTVSPETMGPLAVAAANEAADEDARAAAAAKAEALRVEERRLTELIRRKWAPDSISPACLADIVLVQARVRRWCARRRTYKARHPHDRTRTRHTMRTVTEGCGLARSAKAVVGGERVLGHREELRSDSGPRCKCTYAVLCVCACVRGCICPPPV